MTDPKPTPEDVKRAREIAAASQGWMPRSEDLALEFARVRAEEREACAKIVEADSLGNEKRWMTGQALVDMASLIRARGGS